MLQTVRDCCELQDGALDYAMGDQIEQLADLLDQTEKTADKFFRRNFVTAGMRKLLREGLMRLSGRSQQAVFELKQAMGGGKTHSMLALGILARNPHLRNKVDPSITEDIPDFKASIVAVNGRSVSDDIFIWGDVATQLGHAAEFSRFWKDGPKAPSEADWIRVIGEQPVLMLFDELPPYFDYANTRPVGNGSLANVTTYALSNLLSAALKLPKLCIVISNLSGTYTGASQDLSKVIRNFQDETNRQARSITPVELGTNEIYEILKKRMFERLAPTSMVASVAAEYGKLLSEAAKAKSVSKTAEQIADEIASSYPFHPSVKHLIALFKENEAYRQTRGLMQFVSKMLRSVWERSANDVYLVGCQHLNLNIPDVRDELNRISDLQGALSKDIADSGAAHAEIVDSILGNDAASQVAALLLTASLSESVDAVKGLSKIELIEYLIAPRRAPLEFDQAFDELRKDCWYLHRRENDAYYFSKNENLTKSIESRAKNAPLPKIEGEIKRRLEETFEARSRVAYQRVIALPQISELAFDRNLRVCLVMSPDSKTPPADAKRVFDNVTEKNAFCVVTGDGSSMANLEEKGRRIWAIAKIRAEAGESSPLIPELEEAGENAEFDFLSTLETLFNRVYYPTGVPDQGAQLTPAKLSLIRSKIRHNGEEQTIVDGEAAVEKALSDTGASKLVRNVKEESDRLISRAEQVLWHADRRMPWRDVVTRALDNPRWLWLPPKGLEELRDTAVGQGRWRFTEDGYVEKGPFAATQTSVVVIQKDYNDETGEATIAVTARDAGPSPRIYFAETGDVSEESTIIPDDVFKTTATSLWFLAVDPNGRHTPGAPEQWDNTLTILHQPRQAFSKRTVELKVIPRGNLKWNDTGANPRDGKPYIGPIELTGREPVVLYCYAEANGVTAARNFSIPGLDEKGPRVDPGRPALLARPLQFAGTARVFLALRASRELSATFSGSVGVEIGNGAQNMVARFGTGVETRAEIIERLIELGRETLGAPNAEVSLSIKQTKFKSGRDLEQFCEGLGIEPRPDEIEQ